MYLRRSGTSACTAAFILGMGCDASCAVFLYGMRAADLLVV